MKLAGPVFLALGLIACSPADAPKTAEISAPTEIARSGCNAQASRDWSAVGSQYYVVEAEAHGPTCAEAVATIRIETTEGQVLYTRNYPTRDVPLAFSPNSDQTGLRTEIEEWTQNTSETQRTDELPPWPAGAERPPGFQPAVTRSVYEHARGNQGALFCYPDGGESNACLAVAGTTATFLGSLTPERS
ncbi:MAG: hypothetical protein ACT4OF_02330 [Caulobacteraceae bacterium]